MDDISVHDRTRRELNVPRRDRAGNRSEHGKVVGDDGAFNATGTRNDYIRRPKRTDDMALDIDWSAGCEIALDDKVVGDDAAT